MQLDARKEKILQAIVQDYILTAEPVSSRAIARKYQLGVSPATIRNEMADLEEMGLIEQPHASAGRIPSDKGYRYYVNLLMEKRPLPLKEREYIRTRFAERMRALEEVIRRTGELLAEMSSLVALVLGPRWTESTLQFIQLLPFGNQRALLLIVTNTGIIQHQFLDLPEAVQPEDLKKITFVLNQKLEKMSLREVKRSTLQEIYLELMAQRALVNFILELLDFSTGLAQEGKVYLEGLLNILSQPEFRDPEKLRLLLGVLEEEGFVRELLTESALPGIFVRIGHENKLGELSNCTLITATYELEGRVVGTVGILGPTRMEYARVIALVDFTSKVLSEVLTEFAS